MQMTTRYVFSSQGSRFFVLEFHLTPYALCDIFDIALSLCSGVVDRSGHWRRAVGTNGAMPTLDFADKLTLSESGGTDSAYHITITPDFQTYLRPCGGVTSADTMDYNCNSILNSHLNVLPKILPRSVFKLSTPDLTD